MLRRDDCLLVERVESLINMELRSCIEMYKEGSWYNRALGWEGGKDLREVEV